MFAKSPNLDAAVYAFKLVQDACIAVIDAYLNDYVRDDVKKSS